ncbi:MAG TPA: gliding motility-associated ABC transporter permease subunit GldF [Paludibacter sp.]|nr:gliding motility-associated ABC transporter permease subunit GldF [Paludibacter sp.]
MKAIFKKEIRSFFNNATGYIVIGIFLIINGLFLWILPGEFNIPDNGYANVDGLFYLAPWFFMFLCPAITMRMFAEEKQTGTWELLVTKPISKWNIVTAKYFASLVLVLFALIPTVIYYFSVSYLAEPNGNIDSGAFWGSFIGLILLGAVFSSVGVFASSLSDNQIISFIVAVVISLFLFYGFDLFSTLFTSGKSIAFIENLGVHSHYKSMSRGVIDMIDLLYFLLVSIVFLFFTTWKISKN